MGSNFRNCNRKMFEHFDTSALRFFLKQLINNSRIDKMSLCRSSERGWIIADNVLVMSSTKLGPTTVGKRKVDTSSDSLIKVQSDETGIKCNSCFDLYRLTYTFACQHSYCKGCLRKLFLCALNNRSIPVKCCGKRVDQRLRRDVLTLEELAMFEDVLEEIEAPNKMYWYGL